MLKHYGAKQMKYYTRRERNTNISLINTEGRELTDELEAANEFNKFFASIGEEMAKEQLIIDNLLNKEIYLPERNLNSFILAI